MKKEYANIWVINTILKYSTIQSDKVLFIDIQSDKVLFIVIYSDLVKTTKSELVD